jgi:hypothetical protein
VRALLLGFDQRSAAGNASTVERRTKLGLSSRPPSIEVVVVHRYYLPAKTSASVAD